jgi:hypothetical protein
MPADEVLVVMSVHGGLVQDIGTRRADIPKLRVIVVDHDNFEEGGGQLGYTTEATALEDWPNGPEDTLARSKDELPEDLIAELDIPDPTRHCPECGQEIRTYMKDLDGTNIEGVYGCPDCETVV